MSDITLNGNDSLRGQLKQPYSGAWVAETKIDAQQRPTGAVALTILGRTWQGSIVAGPNDPTAALSGDDAGYWVARIVGGAGGLGKPVTPNEWAQGAVVSQVLAFILTAAGEVQAVDIDPGLLSRFLPMWGVTAGTALGALSALADYLGGGTVWRIRDDGRVWLGVPTPAVVTPPDYRVLEPGPDAGQATWDLNDSSLAPDQTIDGLTLRQVIYDWDRDKLHALVTFAPGPVNNLYGLFLQWQRRIGTDFYRSVPGRIDSQNDSTSAQFQPDSSSYSPQRKAAIYYGLPDTDCQGLSGRAVSAWDGALPTSPALRGFGPSPRSLATKIRVGKSAVFGAQPTIIGTDFRTAQASMDTDLANALTAAAVALNSAGTDATLVSLASAAAAFLVAAGQALGPGTGAAKAVNHFETTSATKNNFLTQIFEAG